MSIYFAFLITALLQWVFLYPKANVVLNGSFNHKKTETFSFLICIELIILAGLRNVSVGADTGVYVQALEYYKGLSLSNLFTAKLVPPFDFEEGYFLLTKLCAFLNLNTTAFLILIAAIIYIPVFKFISENSEHPMISLMTFFAFNFFRYSLGIFRQMIALSIILMGVKYIKSRRMASWLMCVIIASLFHLTAIITIPLYWLSDFKINNKITLFFLSEIVLLRYSRTLILFIVKLFPKYAGFIGGVYDTQGGSYMMLIILNLFLILGYYKIKVQKNIDDKMMNISFGAIIIAIYLQILAYSMGIFGRIVTYYSIFLLILIPKLTNFYFKRAKVLGHMLVMVGLLIIFYFNTARTTDITPYLFIWD